MGFNEIKGKDAAFVGDSAGLRDERVRSTGIRDRKYLTFSLAEEEYGISILKVKEIMGLMPITTVRSTPGFVRGVINLRGKVIPYWSCGCAS
jgi:purine-binding chemotaxis protein CheW